MGEFKETLYFYDEENRFQFKAETDPTYNPIIGILRNLSSGYARTGVRLNIRKCISELNIDGDIEISVYKIKLTKNDFTITLEEKEKEE